MKKALLLLAIVCLPLFASAQTTEKQYYIYNYCCPIKIGFD